MRAGTTGPVPGAASRKDSDDPSLGPFDSKGRATPKRDADLFGPLDAKVKAVKKSFDLFGPLDAKVMPAEDDDTEGGKFAGKDDWPGPRGKSRGKDYEGEGGKFAGNGDWPGPRGATDSGPYRPRTRQIAELITQAAKKFTGDDWPARYAEYVAPKIGAPTSAVEQALKAAKVAHTQYEKQELGKPDSDWQGWYADYVAKQLHKARL